ncbi:MAG: ABC transporter substrate-binding protein/permease [Lachnospiraceae bacterium]|nr:ABC transporter substrate-binding protein/permease [Lachnospiraceae bacterium]
MKSRYISIIFTAFIMLFVTACGGNNGGADSGRLTQFRAEDWDGMKISAITGGVYDKIILDNIPGAEPVYFYSLSDGIEALKNSRIDAVIEDDAALRLHVANNPGLRMLEPFVTIDEYGVAVAKSNDELLAELNEFIAQIKSDGTYDDMLKRWLDTAEQTPMPDIPVGTGETLRFGTSGIVDGFTFYKDGTLAGFDIEFAYRFASFADKRLDISMMDHGALIIAVQSGKIDFAATLFTITEERKQAINFTDPYYIGGAALAVFEEQTDNASVAPGFLQNFKKSFERNLIQEDRWKLIADGLQASLFITIFAFVLATLGGFGVCGLRMSKNPILRAIGSFYITILRGTPIVVLLMITFYIIFAKSSISGTTVAVIAFGASGAAFVGEIIRSAILTIDKGQVEAARSMGFSKIGAFFTVTFPQSVRVAFPTYMSEFIYMFKMTSVVGYISIMDLTKAGDIIRSRTYDAFFPLITVALVYLITASVMIWLFNYINRVTDKRLRRAKK